MKHQRPPDLEDCKDQIEDLEDFLRSILREILPKMVAAIVKALGTTEGPPGPQGAPGQPGIAGPPGPQGPAGLDVAYVGPTAPPNAANGEIWFNTTNDSFNVWVAADSTWHEVMGLPVVGPVGPAGPPGPVGLAGSAATISIGLTTTGAPGTPAAVTNTGNANAAVFNFTVPQGPPGVNGVNGAPGAAGPQGPQGPPGTASTQLGGIGSYYTTYTSTNQALPDGVTMPYSGLQVSGINAMNQPGVWQIVAATGISGIVDYGGGQVAYLVNWLMQRIA